MYPGGNTALGFFSFYDYIASPDADWTLVMKGGPGVGKSTMMKWIGNEMQLQGYDVEYFHCSSDNCSLDAIRVPSLGFSLLDGTAPHVVDPKNPGAVDEIMHLGAFWDPAGIRADKESILQTNAAVGKLFRRAYRYLAAAKIVHDDIEAVHQERFNPGRANEITSSVLRGIFGEQPVASEVGPVRHLFASAITPGGLVHQLHSLMDPIPRKYILKGSPATGKSTLVKKVADAAAERGYLVEAYHCGFDPSKYEHVLIPDLGCAVITSTPPHTYEARGAIVIDMDVCGDTASVSTNAEGLTDSTRIFGELLHQAVAYLGAAKRMHDKLEAYYIPHMDFAKAEELRNQTMERLLARANTVA